MPFSQTMRTFISFCCVRMVILCTLWFCLAVWTAADIQCWFIYHLRFELLHTIKSVFHCCLQFTGTVINIRIARSWRAFLLIEWFITYFMSGSNVCSFFTTLWCLMWPRFHVFVFNIWNEWRFCGCPASLCCDDNVSFEGLQLSCYTLWALLV